MIKTEWYKYHGEHLPPLNYKFITADTAQKTAETNDYSVFQCWGESVDGRAILIDQIRGRWESPDLLVKARAFWAKHNVNKSPTLRAMYVEDAVSGTGLIQTLRREGYSILPIERKAGKLSRDKIARGGDASPFIEAGNVSLPEYAAWLSDFLVESEQFPAGKNDDQLDPMFDAIKIIQDNMLSYSNAASQVNLDSLLAVDIWSKR